MPTLVARKSARCGGCSSARRGNDRLAELSRVSTNDRIRSLLGSRFDNRFLTDICPRCGSRCCWSRPRSSRFRRSRFRRSAALRGNRHRHDHHALRALHDRRSGRNVLFPSMATFVTRKVHTKSDSKADISSHRARDGPCRIHRPFIGESNDFSSKHDDPVAHCCGFYICLRAESRPAGASPNSYQTFS